MRLFLFVPECVVFTWGVTGLSHLAVCHAPIRGDSSGLAGFVLFLLLTPLISTVEARAHRDPGWSSGACPFGLWLDECPFFFFARLVFFFPSDFIFWCLKFGQLKVYCDLAKLRFPCHCQLRLANRAPCGAASTSPWPAIICDNQVTCLPPSVINFFHRCEIKTPPTAQLIFAGQKCLLILI